MEGRESDSLRCTVFSFFRLVIAVGFQIDNIAERKWFHQVRQSAPPGKGSPGMRAPMTEKNLEGEKIPGTIHATIGYRS
jgi:hypothetical protein